MLVDNSRGDADPRRGWIGVQITPEPVFIETDIRIPVPLLFSSIPFLRETQLKMLAVVCPIFDLPCNLN